MLAKARHDDVVAASQRDNVAQQSNAEKRHVASHHQAIFGVNRPKPGVQSSQRTDPRDAVSGCWQCQEGKPVRRVGHQHDPGDDTAQTVYHSLNQGSTLDLEECLVLSEPSAVPARQDDSSDVLREVRTA